MTDPIPDGTRSERAMWLLLHLRHHLGCEFELVADPDAPLAFKLTYPDRTPEEARKVINRQVALHRHEIGEILLAEGEEPARAPEERTRRGHDGPEAGPGGRG